jgi:predicted deacylase
MFIWDKLKLLYKYYIAEFPAKGLEKCTDFPINSIDVDIDKYYKNILSYRDYFEIKELKKINYAGKNYPIYDIHQENKGSSKRILIIAGIHGNEIAGPLAILKLLEDIIKEPTDLYKKRDIRIITIANPVGFAHQSRYTYSGRDVNRDFKRFKTEEAPVLRNVLLKYKPDLLLSLHEGPQKGCFFIFRNTSENLVHDVLEKLEKTNLTLATSGYMHNSLKPRGSQKEGLWVKLFIKIFDINTLETFTEDHCIPAITVETPWAGCDIKERIRAHFVITKEVIRSLR